ncbi:YceI family protein [Kangiella sediminilitoris]|uniref:YceI family protein n=1 Tax=Kangiella sediminilitoris TaxID=1144748 RepID=A0A1B3BDX6_9GAMM|nr:YceI family protein [Kangiella sediminilitoris]AOE50968.1 YceI family protein [Kangiella sediminilitoris]
MKKLIFSLAAISGLAFTQSSNAQAVDYEFDTVHSQIIFKVNHLGYSNSFGKFPTFRGELTFDQEDWSNSSTSVEVKASSIDLENKKWNEHMRSADFFHVEKHPIMSFKSTKLEKTGEKEGVLHGELTILDKTQPITLDLTLNQAGIHPMSEKQHVGFSARGSIKRSEWGMEYGVPAVGDNVDIIIEVEASAK